MKYIVVLFLSVLTSAQANIQLGNFSTNNMHYPKLTAAIEKLKENKIFNQLFTELRNSPRNYLVVAYNEFSQPVIDNNAPQGTFHLGIFIPPEGATFIADNAKGPSNIVQAFQQFRGRSVIAIYFANAIHTEGTQKMNLSEAQLPVIFQEFFHAAQFEEYYASKTNAQVLPKDNGFAHKRFEIEAEIASALEFPLERSKVILNMKNFNTFEESLTAECDVTSQDVENFNIVLANISNWMGTQGYVFQNAPVHFKDLQYLFKLYGTPKILKD